MTGAVKVPIESIEFSVRTTNIICAIGIKYLNEFEDKTESELCKLRNFGRKSLLEVKGVLATYGMKLKEEDAKKDIVEEKGESQLISSINVKLGEVEFKIKEIKIALKRTRNFLIALERYVGEIRKNKYKSVRKRNFIY